MRKKKNKKKVQHDPDWARAKKLCRLNMDDVRKAKELGLNPRKLVKNIPSPSQPWKASVKEWINDLYAKMQSKTAQTKARKQALQTKQHASLFDQPDWSTMQPEVSAEVAEGFPELEETCCGEHQFELLRNRFV